jgi:hypothetical protein
MTWRKRPVGERFEDKEEEWIHLSASSFFCVEPHFFRIFLRAVACE